MTEEEREDIKKDVLNAIKNESNDLTELDTVSSLDNLTSLPGMQGEKLVLAPISLLSKPATDAAAVANAAAATATDAAGQAGAATADASAAATSARNMAAEAQDAASKASLAALDAQEVVAKYQATALLALKGATARFGGFVEIDEEDINNGEIDFVSSTDTFDSKGVKYNNKYKRFLVQSSAKEYVYTWKGSDMYNAGDSMANFLHKDKLYLYGDTLYKWSDENEMLVKIQKDMLFMTEEQYEALAVKDPDALYFILEEEEQA